MIIGAGPYGLAVGSYARRLGLDCHIVGDPMSFWREHMPSGMLLRSPTSWHLDAMGELTFEGFLEVKGMKASEVTPIALGLYLDYCRWFQEQSRLEVEQRYVNNLRWEQGSSLPFRAFLDDGSETPCKACAFRHRTYPVPEPAGGGGRVAASGQLCPYL